MVDVKFSHTDAWSYDASRKVVRVPFWTDGERREALVTLEFLTDYLGALENADPLYFSKQHEGAIEKSIGHKAALRTYEPDGTLVITNADRP